MCIGKTIVSIIKYTLGDIPLISFIAAILSGIVEAIVAIIHELPGFLYACGFGNVYGILEMICGGCNILCCLPTCCFLTISSVSYFLSPLFCPFGCIATLASAIISLLATLITPIMGCFGGCCRTMVCAVSGDIGSDIIGDYITDIIISPIFTIIEGLIIAVIELIFNVGGPIAGIILHIICDPIVEITMAIIEIPFEFCGEVIDAIAELSSIGLSSVEAIFGYGICCLPTITLPCYILQCIWNFICCLPCCWI
jgi:hypothetical protein